MTVADETAWRDLTAALEGDGAVHEDETTEVEDERQPIGERGKPRVELVDVREVKLAGQRDERHPLVVLRDVLEPEGRHLHPR